MSDQNPYKNVPLPSASDFEQMLTEIRERSKGGDRKMVILPGVGWCRNYVKEYGADSFIFLVENGNIAMHAALWDYVNELKSTK